VRTIFIFCVVPRQFEWPQNQILIPDWTYFHCPGATLAQGSIIYALIGEIQTMIEEESST